MASEYLKWKYRDVRPDEPVVLTPQQRRRNWWHYHKWHLLAGAVAVVVAADLLVNVLGIGRVQPDYQAAYVGAEALGEDTAAAFEERLAALGEDCNGDGRVTVQLNQYLTGPEGAEGQAIYAAAGSIQLMADFESCESYFFLLQDPEGFQALYDDPLQEDWIGPTDGLYLARRILPGEKTVQYPEACARLWQALQAQTAG